MEINQKELLLIVATKLGMTKTGNLSGNGLVSTINEMKNYNEKMNKEITEMKNEQLKLQTSIDNLNNTMQKINTSNSKYLTKDVLEKTMDKIIKIGKTIGAVIAIHSLFIILQSYFYRLIILK